MIDELFKDRIDRLWDAIARTLAGTGITPDGVTWTGFVLCFDCELTGGLVFNRCAVYPTTRCL